MQACQNALFFVNDRQNSHPLLVFGLYYRQITNAFEKYISILRQKLSHSYKKPVQDSTRAYIAQAGTLHLIFLLSLRDSLAINLRLLPDLFKTAGAITPASTIVAKLRRDWPEKFLLHRVQSNLVSFAVFKMCHESICTNRSFRQNNFTSGRFNF